jgi:hypothetical protein
MQPHDQVWGSVHPHPPLGSMPVLMNRFKINYFKVMGAIPAPVSEPQFSDMICLSADSDATFHIY